MGAPSTVGESVRETTAGGLHVLVRPMLAGDAPLLVQLFETLSPRSIHHRFLSPLPALSPELIARLTRLDGEHELVRVALGGWQEPRRMLGVARLFGPGGAERAEFSVLVGDPWQGMGVGATLLAHVIRIARERGVGTLWGLVLPENRRMIALGRKFGCGIRQIPGDPDLLLQLALRG